ncbi:hypothetical protein [Culicoidibacter larvae]|uniref:Uncharacterized protein n=1 Tax=Culicoidibacter larvae TaxID=2579976 RepID=A0A5R8Q9V6_9FIRM|nr:hypothetical protein [Culicoidibacter larvae]TLG71403.1 hypothetical protein FEZ08_10945 [Culicoidibacter larvae]
MKTWEEAFRFYFTDNTVFSVQALRYARNLALADHVFAETREAKIAAGFRFNLLDRKLIQLVGYAEAGA